MKAPALAAGLALLLAGAARADIVFLNSGEELSGSVVRVSTGEVVLRADGKDRSYPLARVLKVKLVRVYGVPGEEKASDVADPELKAVLKAPATPADYPDDGALTYLDDKSCDIGADRRAVCTTRVIKLVLRERDKARAANVRFDYLDGSEKGSIDWARAINRDKISNLDDTSVEAGSEYSQFPAYDRLRSLKFAVPDVATGSIVDYRTRVESEVGVATEPFTSAMFFRGFEPAALIRFSVTAPKDMPLDVVASGLPKDAVVRREDLGARVRRVWEVRAAPAIKNEDEMPPYPRLAPFVEVAASATWTSVAADAEASIRARLDSGPEVAAKAAALVAGKTSDAAKVQALYDWVARAIKYQPVTMDSYGYEPKAPAEVFAAKAGDALDKPFLLFALLRAAGFAPRLAYLKNKGDAPFQEALPSLGLFAAAAVALDLDGRRLLLVPLEDSRREGDVPEWLQGTHGLVVFGPGLGETFETPLAPAAREGENDRLKLSLAPDGSLSGTAELSPLGEDQAGWRGLKDLKKEDLDRQFEEFVHGIHPNARLVSYSIDGLEDPDRDLAVRIAFKIKDYALTASGGYMAFRLPWIGASAEDVGKPAREEPMFWWRRAHEDKTVTVSLPRGYLLDYAPPPADLEGPGDVYKASYSSRPGELDFSAASARDAVEVSPADYPAYKAHREDVVRFTERWLVLKKEGRHGAAPKVAQDAPR